MCLPASQKPTDESSLSDVELIVEEQHEEEEVPSASDNESSVDSNLGNELTQHVWMVFHICT